MTTSTLTLTEFLLARIAEDEEAVRRISAGRRWYACDDGHVEEPQDEWDDGSDRLPNHHCTWALVLDPARVLAECEAKRRIVERATCDDAPDCGDHDCRVIDEDRHILAAVYADHEDFREEWRG